MFWEQDDKQSPGLVQWAWNSLLSRETPSHKYRAATRTPMYDRRFSDDTEIESLRRSRPGRFMVDNNGSVHSKRRYYRDNSLILDDSDFGLPTAGPEPDDDVFNPPSRPRSLRGYPGAFPSSYNEFSPAEHRSKLPSETEHRSKLPSGSGERFSLPSETWSNALSSSTARNFRKAQSNTERNKNISLSSSPPVFSAPGPPDNLRSVTKQLEKLRLEKQELEISSKKKYNELKHELINELKNSKELYDEYYKFVNRYKLLKTEFNLNNQELSRLRTENDTLKYRLMKRQSSETELKEQVAQLELRLKEEKKAHRLDLEKAKQKIDSLKYNDLKRSESAELKYTDDYSTSKYTDDLKYSTSKYTDDLKYNSQYKSQYNDTNDSIDLLLEKKLNKPYLKARPKPVLGSPETSRRTALHLNSTEF